MSASQHVDLLGVGQTLCTLQHPAEGKDRVHCSMARMKTTMLLQNLGLDDGLDPPPTPWQRPHQLRRVIVEELLLLLEDRNHHPTFAIVVPLKRAVQQQIWWHDHKVDYGSPPLVAQCSNMMLVPDEQWLVQQLNTTRVQIMLAVPPNHNCPDHAAIAHVGLIVPQESNEAAV